MIIYVCYFDYGDWDNCSHPVCFFTEESQAQDWERESGGLYQEMELGRTYAHR